MKDSASVSIAIGPPRKWMSAPPIDGPATPDKERLPLRSELACTYSSRLATATNRVDQEMSKATDKVPTAKANRSR